jgi:hypothetical protein
VTDAADFRRHAEECLRAARTSAATAEIKTTLLTMSRLWTALAVQTERLQAHLDAESARQTKEPQ